MKNWNHEMTAAYLRGLRDGREGHADDKNEKFKECYLKGVGHARMDKAIRERLEAERK